LAIWISTFPQNILAAFILATLSYYLLEKPFLALKNKSSKVQAPVEN
jgi:peptidoglycan/LPS O-acetylase OafA/YrhL